MGSETRDDDATDTFGMHSDGPRMPSTVAVALLKDAAARAAYVRSELAAMKATQISLMSPGRDSEGGSPGALSPNPLRFHTTSSFSSSPSTARTHQKSISPNCSQLGPSAAADHNSRYRVIKADSTQAGHPPQFQSSECKDVSPHGSLPPNRDHLERKISSARYPPKEQAFPVHPPIAPETARARIMQRMRNVNAAMDEISKKKMDRSNTSLDTSNLSHRVSQDTSRPTGTARVGSDFNLLAKGHVQPVVAKRFSIADIKPLSPPHASSSPIAADAVEVRVMETHVSLASLMKPTAQTHAAPAPKRQTRTRQSSKTKPKAPGQPAAAPRGKSKAGNSAVGGAGGYAAQHRKKPKRPAPGKKNRSAAKASSPQDSGLGPWSNGKLDESVTTLLATVDRKIARDYENLSSMHHMRSSTLNPAKAGSGARVESSALHSQQPSVDTSFDGLLSDASDRDQPRLLQPARGQLVPNEVSMPPSPDPFYTCDPEELARQLYPDDVSTPASRTASLSGLTGQTRAGSGVRQPGVPSSHDHSSAPLDSDEGLQGVAVSPASHIRAPSTAAMPTDTSGDLPAEDGVDSSTGKGAGTPDNSFASPGGPSRVLSPKLPVETPDSVPEQLLGQVTLVSSLLGESRSSLSVLALDEVVQEVARGSYMNKRKQTLAEEPTAGITGATSGGSGLIRKLSRSMSRSNKSHSANLSGGSRRRVQLLLDNRRALLAYRRGGFRGTVHGRVTSVQAAGGTWKSSDEITVITDGYTFHLIPVSARDYYIWVLALNFSLHYLEGAPIDDTIAAADIPLHPRFKTINPIMVSSLAQWASPPGT